MTFLLLVLEIVNSGVARRVLAGAIRDDVCIVARYSRLSTWRRGHLRRHLMGYRRMLLSVVLGLFQWVLPRALRQSVVRRLMGEVYAAVDTSID